MKLSISFPDNLAMEIKDIAKSTDRSVSWWLQCAWLEARKSLLDGDDPIARKQRALKHLEKIRGAIKDDYPNLDSVDLAKQSFKVD